MVKIELGVACGIGKVNLGIGLVTETVSRDSKYFLTSNSIKLYFRCVAAYGFIFRSFCPVYPETTKTLVYVLS